MRNRDAHLSDEELLLAADGELSAARAVEMEQHLGGLLWMRRVSRQPGGPSTVQAEIAV